LTTFAVLNQTLAKIALHLLAVRRRHVERVPRIMDTAPGPNGRYERDMALNRKNAHFVAADDGALGISWCTLHNFPQI
jgi:hypothetical protein